MKYNLHTHSVYCDGRDDLETMVLAAIERDFDVLGFSSHAMFPHWQEGYLSPEKIDEYVNEIKLLRKKYAERIKLFIGVEADYILGELYPDCSLYLPHGVEYVIGSVHWVLAPDGVKVPVDHTPELLADGLRCHFNNDGKLFVKTYLSAVREMVSSYDFDIVGHPDLYRKFNSKLKFFDEQAFWYQEEIEKTVSAIASSSKVVEINTGAISRGWMADAYPSAMFMNLLHKSGVRLIISSDSHFAGGLDCAFDRFAKFADVKEVSEIIR